MLDEPALHAVRDAVRVARVADFELAQSAKIRAMHVPNREDVDTMERFTTEEDCKRLGLRPAGPCTYPVHPPIPAPQQLGKLGFGWVRVVCHTCKLQYDVDQIEHYRHPSVLHVAEFVCPRGHIATSRRVFTSVDDKPAEDERGEGSAE